MCYQGTVHFRVVLVVEGGLGARADLLVEHLGFLAGEDPPCPGSHPVQNDGRRLIGEPLRMSTAATMTECLVSRLEKAAVIRAIHDDLVFAEFFLMYVLNRTVRLTDDLIDHMFNSSEKRLARILLLLANYGKEGRVETVISKIDHQTLAQMVGTTRSRVNFFMNKFRKLGYIDYNDRISVHSSLLNVVLLDQPDAFDGPEHSEI